MKTVIAPTVIKKSEIQMMPCLTAKAGKGKDPGLLSLAINPPQVNTKALTAGTAEINPGFAPHAWHTHDFDKGEGFEVNYPNGFEELYYITSGSGVVQWETEEGKVKELKVDKGDFIFFPIGVAKHQVLNTGSKKLTMVWAGTPTVAVTPK